MTVIEQALSVACVILVVISVTLMYLSEVQEKTIIELEVKISAPVECRAIAEILNYEVISEFAVCGRDLNWLDLLPDGYVLADEYNREDGVWR